jgi:PEP-CTERM motif
VDCTATPGTGCIYTTTGGNNTLLRINPNFVLDPNNPANNVAAIIKTISLNNCSPAGFDVNPADNVGLLGCNPGGPNGAAQQLINLNNDSIIRSIPGITATDVLAFDPSLGEWFTASQNFLVSNGCPQAQNTGIPATPNPQFPQVGGIFDNPNIGLQTACSGQGAHGLGVDTTNNRVYVPVGIFPANGSAGLNSFVGILVFQATAVPEPSSLLLMAFGLIFVFTYSYRRSVQN